MTETNTLLVHLFGTVTGPSDPEREFSSLIPAGNILLIDLIGDPATAWVDRGFNSDPLEIELDGSCVRWLRRTLCYTDAEELISLSGSALLSSTMLLPSEIAAIHNDGRIVLKGGGEILVSFEEAERAMHEWADYLGGVL